MEKYTLSTDLDHESWQKKSVHTNRHHPRTHKPKMQTARKTTAPGWRLWDFVWQKDPWKSKAAGAGAAGGFDHNYKFPLRQSHSEKVSAQFDMAGSVFKENKCDDTGERKGTGQWRVNGRATETVRAWVKVRQPEQGTKEVTELETVTPWRGKGSQLDTSEDEERSGYL